jgi:hypothetical protein
MTTMSTLIEVVEAVAKAKRRIPYRLRMFRFFSDWDLWDYEVVDDTKLCRPCRQHEDATYIGSKIRLLFPHLTIINQNTIHPHVHPNCRCGVGAAAVKP